MVVSSPSPRRRRPLVVDVTFCVHPGIRFERYADDAICHCTSEAEASALHRSLEERFADCGLTLHPEKTKIVYCKDDDRRGTYPNQKFDFLGYTRLERDCPFAGRSQPDPMRTRSSAVGRADASDPTKQRETALEREVTRTRKAIDRLLTAYQEALLSLDELRRRMPELRQREHALQTELNSRHGRGGLGGLDGYRTPGRRGDAKRLNQDIGSSVCCVRSNGSMCATAHSRICCTILGAIVRRGASCLFCVINQSRSKFIFTRHIAKTVSGRTNKSSRDSFAGCAWQRSPCA